jgi:hypothetical protein
MDAPSTTSASPAVSPAAAKRGVRGQIAIVVGLVAIVVLLVVFVLASSRGPAVYPVGSPEAAFQRYLAAWDAGDYPGAYAAFSSRIHARVTFEEYRTEAPRFDYGGSDQQRVVLVNAKVSDTTATLNLRVEHWTPGGGLGGGSSWSQSTSVAMVKENGAWYVDDYLAGMDQLGYMP